MNERARAQAANRPQTNEPKPDMENAEDPDEYSGVTEEIMSKSETPTDNESSTDTTENDGQRLYAAPTGPNTYTVLSRGDAGRNAYSVDVANLTCTCEDFQYNVKGDDDRNVCKHLEKAISIHPHQEAYYSYKGGQVAAVDVTQSAKDKETASAVEETEVAITDSVPSPEEKADTLQAAYDGVIDDMQVQANEGLVWVQTGRDTPDAWPFPGADSTFDALLKNAELMTFVGEGNDDYPDHEWLSRRPGQWWKNAIEPENVDSYINEVLD